MVISSPRDDFSKNTANANKHVHDGQNCSLYEAVRVLRAMSKSVRITVEQHRRRLKIYPINANVHK